jgi:RNA polymerase sigma factor (sigma-70 family)
MADSQNLVAEYVRTGSELAFRELVTRYINLVYSTALRVVGGDTHLAEDVTQTVFVHLARKAHRLSNRVMLGGWLHRATLNVATTIVRGESRRKSRERQSVEMNSLQDHTEANLAQFAPILDEAIDNLGAEDRNAILLRFFEQLDFRSVGEMLDTNEDAARKRVTRALEKLHSFLKHRGVTLSAAALGTALANEAVAVAPVGLAASIAGTALAGAAAGKGIALTLIKTMTMTKLNFGIVAAVAVACLAASLVQHRSRVKLLAENQTLQHQAAQFASLAADNERLSNLLAQANSSLSLSATQSSEVLRLRGEVGRLRREAFEAARTKAPAQQRSDVSTASEKSELDRLNQLIEWLRRNPSENSPELKLLTAQEWLKFMDDKLNTDGDYLRNIAHVRAAVELTKITPALYSALKEYVKVNNGQFPTGLSQMKLYFDSPIDDAILQRWEIIPVTSVSPLIVKSGVDMGGAWVITQKGPVNAEWDARVLIGTTNYLASLEPNRWSIEQ